MKCVEGRKSMWHLYILECGNKSLYTGIAKNIDQRVKTHNSGQGSAYTRSHLPVKCVYKESHQNYSKALKRETQIKSWSREKKLALINRDFTGLKRLSESHD